MSGVRWVMSVVAVVWVVLALPLALVQHPEIVDFPAHLARHELVGRLPADAVLSQMYTVDWQVLPNLGMDLLVIPLQWVLSASGASRAGLALGMLGWLLGPVVLYRVWWQRWSVWPVASGLVVYNATLYMGFENFYGTVPLVMLGLAAWSASESHLSTGRRVALLAGMAALTWVGHLVAWGIFAVCVVAWELGAERPWGARLRAVAGVGVAFLPGAVWFVAAQLANPAAIGQRTQFAGMGWQKLGVLLAPALQYQPTVDLLHVMVLLPALWVVPFLVGTLELHRRARVVVGALAVVSLLMPSMMLGIFHMDQRVPCVLVPILFAASRISVSRTMGGVLGAWVAVGLLLRVGTVVPRWRAHDRQLRELHEVVGAVVEPGQRVLPGGQVPLRHYHAADGLVVRSQVYLPSLFTGAQILDVTPEFQSINAPAPTPEGAALLTEAAMGAGRFASGAGAGPYAYLAGWPEHFDVLVWLEPQAAVPQGVELTRVASGSWFEVYRVQ